MIDDSRWGKIPLRTVPAHRNSRLPGRVRRKLRQRWISDKRLKLYLLSRIRRKRLAKARASGHGTIKEKYWIRKRDLVRKTENQTIELTFPENLSFLDNLHSSVEFLHRVERAFFVDRARKVRIDHSQIKKLGPEAALLLIATFERVTVLSPRSSLSTKTSKLPNDQVLSVLKQAGYFDYFSLTVEIPDADVPQILSHRTGRKVAPPAAEELILHFEHLAGFPSSLRKKLGKALIECMENAILHAFPPGFSARCLKNQWWMLGYRDMARGTIWFAFYDQGVGIPRTIRTRVLDQKLFRRKDGDILVEAIVEGHYSRTKEKSRGRGLPLLLEFVELADDGKLTVVSDCVRCDFIKGKDPRHYPLEIAFPGTLIIWEIKI